MLFVPLYKKCVTLLTSICFSTTKKESIISLSHFVNQFVCMPIHTKLLFIQKIATIQLSFSSPFCTKFIYNVYINVPWWDYGKKNVCTTDALLRNKVNVLKINLLQFLLSFFWAAWKQEVMHRLVVAEWGHWCSIVTIMLQTHCLLVSMPPPTSLLKTLPGLQQLINHCWWLQFFPSFQIYICSGQFKYGE